ncbi:MAG: aminomethyl-transferring glycine dehydrogenase subunit GcvPA [Panacagrimonas sp.]
MPFIPHTDADTRQMLGAIGAPDIECLFDEIPASLRCGALEAVPPGLPEMDIARLMSARAAQDAGLINFCGAGAYEHHIPAAVWEITTRGEFYSAYTPYQAEASQGGLQLLYEFQTMMASLTGLDVSNASLYDGASALAEAVLMAARTLPKNDSGVVLLPRAIHPFYAEVVQSCTAAQGFRCLSVDFDPETGQTPLAAYQRYADQNPVAVVIGQPNFFGVLEEVDAVTNWAQQIGARAIGVVNPTSLAVLKPPGQWGDNGADLACGEGQPLGAPLSGGGPYFGFMTCKKSLVRQMPGRIAGRTVDLDGKPGFALTLQAREQHIRRAKATSNICTNQGLLVTAATIYMSIVGAKGLSAVAQACMNNTARLLQALSAIDGVEPVFSGPIFHESVIRLPQPVQPVLERLAQEGLLGGFDLSRHFPALGNAMLVCATETRTPADIDHYSRTLSRIISA